MDNMWKRMAVGANSNTTLVKVKLQQQANAGNPQQNSNTTLVKVK